MGGHAPCLFLTSRNYLIYNLWLSKLNSLNDSTLEDFIIDSPSQIINNIIK